MTANLYKKKYEQSEESPSLRRNLMIDHFSESLMKAKHLNCLFWADDLF